MKAPQFITDLGTPPMPDRYRQLARLEPRLEGLWGDANHYAHHWEARPMARLDGKAAAWKSIKAELVLLVGLDRIGHDDILGTQAAYDCAFRALLDAIGV